MSDANGDVYFRGHGGAAGESVTEADREPSLSAAPPRIVATYLGGRYTSFSSRPYALDHATVAWLYRFRLPGGRHGVAVRAWVKPTLSQVWLIVPGDNQVEQRVLGTLTVAR